MLSTGEAAVVEVAAQAPVSEAELREVIALARALEREVAVLRGRVQELEARSTLRRYEYV